MDNIEMIKLEDAGKAARVPMLPGSIPGAEVTLVTADAGGELALAPIPGKARILLTIDGAGVFAAGGARQAFSGRWIFIPSFEQHAALACAEKTRILEIVWQIPDGSIGEWEHPGQQFPYIQEYWSCPQYRDKNKSDKTISREMVRQRIVPGFCMGSVESYGYDKVAQHPHPMLDQFFFSFPENDTEVLIDDFRVPQHGDTLLHIPLGSNHGVEVFEPNHMHYIWIDFFLGQAGLDRLDSSHRHTGTMRSFSEPRR